ncbi:hypothetical protein Goklo_008185 [Gossypium klotzschianum]|uniref:Uncharacterized protein n=1 Tax=Gossypium klotzschianum TaxID=34286 RepID=A0A7J8UZA9_9ROSI|nr:hypothetical protein [Gossypium klotzschianum]
MIPKEESNYHGCEADVSLGKMDVSTTQSQPSKPNQDDSTFSKKKKNRFMLSQKCTFKKVPKNYIWPYVK